MCLPANKKETQACLGIVDYWRMHLYARLQSACEPPLLSDPKEELF